MKTIEEVMRKALIDEAAIQAVEIRYLMTTDLTPEQKIERIGPVADGLLEFLEQVDA